MRLLPNRNPLSSGLGVSSSWYAPGIPDDVLDAISQSPQFGSRCFVIDVQGYHVRTGGSH